MLWLVLLFAACVDADPPALRGLASVVANQDGQNSRDATQKLVAYGRRALVVIEAALHTAPPAGRRRLIRAIAQIGDRDACALLAHFARYDEDLSVREEAAATSSSLVCSPHK